MQRIITYIILTSVLCSLSMLSYLLAIMLSEDNDYLLAKPNLVLFSVDTLRADHLKIYGYHRETAPNLSQMAAEGFIFEQAFTVSTHSAPAHAAILTGLYPPQHGQLQNGIKLPDQIDTLAEHLKRQDYVTAGFVSDIVLGEESNLQQGFDVFGVDHIHSGSPINITQSWSARVWTRAKKWLETWQKDLIHSQAEGKDYQRKPFFLWLHANHPHGNYNPPPGYRKLFMQRPEKSLQQKLSNSHNDLDKVIRSSLRNNTIDQALIDWANNLYDGEIRFADHLFGELLQFLKQNGEYDRTIIIFVSDHGEMLFEQSKTGQERSAAHHAGLYYEQVLKIPLVIKPSIHMPEPRGQRVSGNIASIDIFTAAFELLGLSPPAEIQPQTQSIFPFLQSPSTEPGRQKIYFAEKLFNNHCSGLKEQEWRLIRCETPRKLSKSILFNLAKDPHQNTNQYKLYPAKAEQMEQSLKHWLAKQKTFAVSEYKKISKEMRKALEAGGYIKKKAP